GNISLMATTIAQPLAVNTDLLNPLPQINAYRYDQLNRILQSRSFDNVVASTNKWGTGPAYQGRYFNNFSYDANGNIVYQKRYDSGGAILDQFHYLYDSAASCANSTAYRTMRNRLTNVVNTASGLPQDMAFYYDAIG